MSKVGGGKTAPGGEGRKVSGELFVLTYGAMVTQLIKDYEEDQDINRQLDKMAGTFFGKDGRKWRCRGYNIGLRIIDDFLAKNPGVGRCNGLRQVADVLAKVGFRTYLGVTPAVTGWSAAEDEFSLVLESNPLTELVELPPDSPHKALNYSQVLCGAIRGALEMVQLEVESWFVSDALRGDASTEIRVRFLRRLEDSVPIGDDD